jgi:ribose transport system permease protein
MTTLSDMPERAPTRGRLGSMSVRLGPLSGAWLLPTVAAIVIYAVMSILQSGLDNYNGINLVVTPLLPLVFAAFAQMFIIAAGDIDLSVGSFIGLVNCVFAVTLPKHGVVGVLMLIGLVLAYGAMGVLIVVRRLPAIIVTLGMSFVWLGLAIVILPTPGGAVPSGIVSFATYNTPGIPTVLIWIVAVTAVIAVFLLGTRYGTVLRGAGANAEGVRRAGWSTLRAKVVLYLLAGVMALLAGLFLSGQSGGGDPNVGQSYVLLSIAGVIVGGGAFSGGDVSVVGTAAGALVVGMIGSLLQILEVSSNYQVGAQGLVLVIVLVVRSAAALIQRRRLTQL